MDAEATSWAFLRTGAQFAKNILAMERDRRRAAGEPSLTIAALAQEIVPTAIVDELTAPLSDAKTLISLSAQIENAYARARSEDDVFSRCLVKSYKTVAEGANELQSDQFGDWYNQIPYVILCWSFLRVHFSTKDGLEVDFPNPDIVKPIVDGVAEIMDRFRNRNS